MSTGHTWTDAVLCACVCACADHSFSWTISSKDDIWKTCRLSQSDPLPSSWAQSAIHQRSALDFDEWACVFGNCQTKWTHARTCHMCTALFSSEWADAVAGRWILRSPCYSRHTGRVCFHRSAVPFLAAQCMPLARKGCWREKSAPSLLVGVWWMGRVLLCGNRRWPSLNLARVQCCFR